MTHLGCTLFRHCFHAAWRYSRYHLGQSVPERAQVVIVHLRPYFEGSPSDPLDDVVLDPGSERSVTLPARVTAAMAFHRLRLRWRRYRATDSSHNASKGSDPWVDLRRAVSARVPCLGEAMLGDVISVRRRRAARAAGRSAAPCSSPRTPSWVNQGRQLSLDLDCDSAARMPTDRNLPRADPPRGAFRDAWIETVADLQPKVVALGETATRLGLIEGPGDALFVPFDHLDVLAGDTAPGWLTPAIASNRAEWSALAESEAPPEVLQDRKVGVRLQRPAGDRLPAVWAPLP